MKMAEYGEIWMDNGVFLFEIGQKSQDWMHFRCLCNENGVF